MSLLFSSLHSRALAEGNAEDAEHIRKQFLDVNRQFEAKARGVLSNIVSVGKAEFDRIALDPMVTQLAAESKRRGTRIDRTTIVDPEAA
ncbi:MAG: hypothetical protein ACREIT_04555 [Tepidisphaeraceae bacterium]